MDILDMSIKIFLGFSALILLTNILGKTQLSQIKAFDFISALILGELLGNAIYDSDVSFFLVLFAIFFGGTDLCFAIYNP